MRYDPCTLSTPEDTKADSDAVGPKLFVMLRAKLPSERDCERLSDCIDSPTGGDSPPPSPPIGAQKDPTQFGSQSRPHLGLHPDCSSAVGPAP